MILQAWAGLRYCDKNGTKEVIFKAQMMENESREKRKVVVGPVC